jgi:hypothetical protein
MIARPRTVAASLLAGLAIAGASQSLAAEQAGGGQIARMLGRWSGEAQVTPTSGPARSYKCVVTYRGTGDASQMAQNLRCKSDGYSLEAATMLSFNGREVTGKWEDRINAVGGDVKGTLTDGGFEVHLGGKFFEANMQVAGSDCVQLVKLTPVRAEYIKELSASLKKC